MGQHAGGVTRPGVDVEKVKKTFQKKWERTSDRPKAPLEPPG